MNPFFKPALIAVTGKEKPSLGGVPETAEIGISREADGIDEVMGVAEESARPGVGEMSGNGRKIMDFGRLFGLAVLGSQWGNPACSLTTSPRQGR